ncbi:hypothetical protein A2715_01005 [Candidatus Woesebacteria bacterium RIFCSPHIGHO2_01_FULL_39_32]|uniref:Uncharacterized protein n=2 Tax=Candidatus Woeseibacteriota TaxID=1752722 RepID=A0A0G0PR15_9BACT|nr:MAG: hypothetical protein UT61_C0008G0024 [Candidatus Woesebacteria bacterium GW2011_GWA1_39_8]OGM04037.1 MAG: hypothetical protein A2124_02115 [Candidatus Woesebacteria bacterium GWB1_37_5]OGM24485.1 MAG: hypothetical protein A2715_01005 [Candidatus Woesebacteria bacterium RIFCSPHIGHO2_01_FULL_39_32]OGM38884.1 MAG: hypothetical protein A3F01_03860 [Candidatus Woesebacteria bacterium RIFCSPHIGHO2_12_FULL_38_11]OGM63791.1 MAG: hypothetical protein A2893_02340 [Candidatus Woesebacteria bacteri
MEPERKDQEPQPQIPEGVREQEEEMPEPTPELQEMGVQKVPSQVTAQIVDDTGAQLIQTPSTQVVTITIPASAQQLDDWSKGSPAESLTWLAFFWLRLIKKAIHFGWRIVMKGVNPNVTNNTI